MALPAERPKSDETKAEEMTNGDNGLDSATSDNTKNLSSSSPDLHTTSSTPHHSSTSSAVPSPKASRETSPIRPPLKPGTTAGPRSRSRKNSQDLSPIRGPSASNSNIPSVPSAAAIQRALSAGTLHLPPSVTQDLVSDTPRSQKTSKVPPSGSQSTGSNTPRLRSPPPSSSSGLNKTLLSTARKTDQSQSTPTTPAIVLERPSRLFAIAASDSDAGDDDRAPKTGMRTPTRGLSGSGPALETVQESSLPATPAIGTTKSSQTSKGGSSDRPEKIEENPMEEAFGTETQSKFESGNESAGNRSGEAKGADGAKERRKPATAANSARPIGVQSKRSFSQLPFTKGKTASEGSVRNMTVETETVSSIPQVALGGGAGERNGHGRTETGGSLRLKPSNETIKPKKEKKKVVRKAPSLNSGTARTASSKADIFEAKVANAVNETNSSDSEETFVYESNPPEPPSTRPHRFHSRTPSATSIKSQIENYGGKGRPEGHHSIVGKKSMKFANNYNSIGYANDAEGTVRGPHQASRTVGSDTLHHPHIGRYGRGGHHTSILDSDSPFPNGTKQARSAPNHLGHVSPRHGSPRNPHVVHVTKSPRKAEDVMSYDLEGEGADDERAPLMGSMRTARNRRRPLPGSVRQMYAEDRGHRFCGRVTAFTVLGSIITLLIAAITAICILCSKPLIDVHIKDLRNVLASEQEIMLDLHVHAINPNIISIQVSDLDVNIFAKSSHVGTGEFWRSHPHITQIDNRATSDHMGAASLKPLAIAVRSSNLVHQLDGVDKGTDPINDPADDAQTMLLGQIFDFDSPLTFDPSPFRHQSLGSVGEVRLAKPGNRTEEGGSQRWEHVLKYDFELIVRGVIRYSSPISSKVHSASIAGRVVVHPGQDIDDSENNKS